MEDGSGGADTEVLHNPGEDKERPDIDMREPEQEEARVQETSDDDKQGGDAAANSESAAQTEQAPTTEPIELDANGGAASTSAGGDKVSDQVESRQVEMLALPVDPELVKQDESTGELTSADGAATRLMRLAGGAIFLSTQNAGVNSAAWGHHPSSPESPNFNSLPSMIGQNSSPTSRDDKHITLPSINSINSIDTLQPINSIEVLAELATKGDSSQQGWNGSRMAYPQVQANHHISSSNKLPTAAQSPSHLPTPSSSEGTPRPALQHLTAQQRQPFLIPNEHTPARFYHEHTHTHTHTHYPPINKDNSASPQSSYAQPATPDSANLFARSGVYQHSGPEGRRLSASSEFQYNSDHASTPRGPPTAETLAGSPSADELPVAPAPPPPPAPALRNRNHAAALATGGFKCDHEGCTAPPFQTQYLLNSHANVHSSARPHYCPVKGCARAEGGKGFKRKNEMIRHGLVHASPGYICPFCPDKEHKYPRPDNLQRHVRVHHVDKDKDDPQLREVLSQRPEGGNRGRRRRNP